jgi:putative spermidine/putrescine transport system permease protein
MNRQNLPLASLVAAILLFMLAPILIISAYAFSSSNVQSWPIGALSLRWFSTAAQDEEVRAALLLSLQVASLATAIAVLLGTLAALAVHRVSAGWSQIASVFLVLPIALPGVITGMSLNSYFAALNLDLGFASVVVGHATFCIVIVYNNVLARLRRLPASLAQASADLGASPLTTFRRITLPMTASAIGAGALLAFALSFDEVIVTTFTAGVQTTLPLWILGAIRLGQHMPEVNVVVFVVILLTVLPVIAAQRLSGDAGALHK